MKGVLTMQMTGEKDGARRGTRDFSRDFFDHSRHRPLRMTSTKSSPRQMFTSEAAQKIITKKMRQKSTKLLNIFRFLDKNGDGCINHEEFREALQHMGISMTDYEFQKLLKAYAGAFHNGVMPFQAFRRQFSQSVVGGTDVAYQEAIMTQKPVIRRQQGHFMKADEAFRALTQKMIGGTNVQKFFRRFDSDQDGTISIPEFRAGLGMMGIRMDDKEFHGKFVGLFGSTFNDGEMDIKEFHQIFSKYRNGTGKQSILDGMKARVVRQPIVGRSLTADAARKIFFRKLSYGKSYAQTFRKIDYNKDGSVSKDELQRALAGMGINMNKTEFRKFLSSYPDHFDRNGQLNFAGFQKMFSTEPSNTRVIPVNQEKPKHGMLQHRGARMDARAANQVFLRKLAQKGKSVTEAFRRMDTDHNNKISKVEFRTALMRLGIDLDDANFAKFMKFYENVFDDSGVMNIQDFKKQFGHILEGHGIGATVPAIGPIIPINTYEDEDGPRKRLPNGRKAPGAGPKTVSHTKAHDMLCEEVKPSALRKALERMDRDNDGMILIADFRTALMHVGINLSDSAFRKLVDLYSEYTNAGTFFSGSFADAFSAISSVKSKPHTGRNNIMSHELAYKRATGNRNKPKVHALWHASNNSARTPRSTRTPRRPSSARPSSARPSSRYARKSARPSARRGRPGRLARASTEPRRRTERRKVEAKVPDMNFMVNPKSSREAIRLLLEKVKPSVAESWKFLRKQLIQRAASPLPVHTAAREDFVKVLCVVSTGLTVREAGFLATAFQKSRASTEVDFNNFIRVVLTTKTRRRR